MKAIILAAGKGTRLRPLTDSKPKCLVELAGKSLLEHQLDTLSECGITDIHVIGGYYADQLVNAKYKLHQNYNYNNSNMVHTLFVAMEELTGREDIIISYGDIVYQKNVLQKLIDLDAPISLVIDRAWLSYWKTRMEDPLTDLETLKLDNTNKIIEIGKKPQNLSEIDGQYIGLIKVNAQFVTKLKNTWQNMDKDILYDGKDYDNMYMTSYLQMLINLGWDIRATFIENGWAEIDCLADLDVALANWKP